MWHDAISTESDSISPTTFTFSTDRISFTYYLSLPLAILASIGVLFLIYRLKILSNAVATMHLHKAAALQSTLPTFISFFTPSSPTNTSLTASSTKCTEVTHTFSLSPYLLILCVILLALLLLKNLRRSSLNTNYCKSWYDHTLPSYMSADTSRDLVTLTFDPLTLNVCHAWRVTWPTLPPSLKTLRLSVLELWVITFPVGYHWKCVRGYCACAESRDPWVGGQKQLHFFVFSTPICLFTMQLRLLYDESN